MFDLETIYKLYSGKKQRGTPPMTVRQYAKSCMTIPPMGYSQVLEKIKQWKSTKTIIREIYLDDSGITFVEQSVAKLNSEEKTNES